tara:strand:+ start:2874 stop:4118 length:1245 start_codon:yes stop_codon:yes gene_type:complete
MVGGLGVTSGGTSGLRYNPRQSPEELIEDKTLGAEDPEGKVKNDEKKRKKRDERKEKIAGLRRHIKVQSKKKKDRDKAKKDAKEVDEDLNSLTGPVGSRGEPLDTAVGARTGTGSTMGEMGSAASGLPFGGTPLMRAFDSVIISKKENEKEKKEPTHTMERSATREKIKHTQQKGKGTKTLESSRKGRRGKKGIATGSRRRKTSVLHAGQKRAMSARPFRGPKGILPTLRGQPNIGVSDPRTRATSVARRTTYDNLGSVDAYTPPSPMSHASKRHPFMRARGSFRPAAMGAKRIHTPRTADTPMGAQMSQETSLAGGTASPFAAPLAKAQPKLKQSDVTEFKFLLRELKRMMRQGTMRKSFGIAGHKDRQGDPSPNGHPIQTSSPTGATSIDPDDDPRYWGSHPIGIVARRGHA